MFEKGEGHTVKRLDEELINLNQSLLDMGGMVFESINDALNGVVKKESTEVQKVFELEDRINAAEQRINSEIIAILAKWSPRGSDLRLVMAVHIGIIDLERAADEAVRIAGLVNDLKFKNSTDPSSFLMDEVNCMGHVVTDCMQQAIRACESWDEALAMKLIDQRSELEHKFHSSMERLIHGVKTNPEHVTDTLAVILLVKSLERILHHARNLAEVVIVRIRGETASDLRRIN